MQVIPRVNIAVIKKRTRERKKNRYLQVSIADFIKESMINIMHSLFQFTLLLSPSQITFLLVLQCFYSISKQFNYKKLRNTQSRVSKFDYLSISLSRSLLRSGRRQVQVSNVTISVLSVSRLITSAITCIGHQIKIIRRIGVGYLQY